MCRRNHLYHSLFWVMSLISVAGQAEVTFDNSLGQPITPDTLSGEIIIPEGRGTLVGSNLFHSFQDFNINTGESATFTGQSPVENILGRVTGDNDSLIDGLLRTRFDNSDPNLFLMNPNGILFGPNASLDVEGSFHVTTADYLRVGDDGFFHADLNRKTSLSVAPIEAFGFTDVEVGDITIDQSQLVVAEEATVSLIGGNINFDGGGRDANGNINSFLFTNSGRINLVSVASSGEVLTTEDYNVADFDQLGNIQLSNDAIVDTSGSRAGRIVIRGNSLSLDQSLIVSDNLQDGDRDGRGIHIALTGDLLLENNSLIESGSFRQASGNGGNIDIVAKTIELRNGALINVNTFTKGNGGDLNIKSDNIQLEGDSHLVLFTGITAQTSGLGNAGHLNIQTQQIEMRNSEIDASTFGKGRGGLLTIQAQQIKVHNFASIGANTFGDGNAGDIHITTSGLLLDAESIGIFTEAKQGSAGSAGDLTIDAQQIDILNDAEISASTFATSRTSNAGNINIEAEKIALTGDGRFGGIFTQSGNFNSDIVWDAGNAGNITITAADLNMTGSVKISTNTFSQRTSNAGNINIEAEKIALTGEGGLGGIFAQSGNPNSDIVWDAGNAGNITITGGNLNMKGSVQIATSTFSNQGKGGILDIDLTGVVKIIDDSQDNTQTGLFSNTNRAGQGGSLKLRTTGDIVLDGGRILTRTLGSANAGSLTVKSANLHIINGGQIFSGIGNAGADFVGFSEGAGTGGDIDITVTDTLSISGEDSRGFNSGLFGSAQIGNGNAGNIVVSANKLEIKDGGQISSLTSDVGNGGDITINVKEIDAYNGAQISASSKSQSTDAGVSGNVTITAIDSLRLTNDSQISVETAIADASNINLQVGHLLQLSDNSAITTSAAVVNNQGTGNGGNITIKSDGVKPAFAILDNGSQIKAQAKEGDGGNIEISVSSLFKSPNSMINASSQFGQSGTVTIDSPDTNVIEGALILPGSFLDASALLSQRCAARGGKRTSSFIVKPLEGFQPAPDDYLSGFYTDTAATAPDISQQKPVNNAFPLDIAVSDRSILCL